MTDRQSRTTKITGTAMLAALVVLFDYALKYSGLKIPFPLYPNLKFDFTGVPIALSLLFFGLLSSVTTSLVAFIAILARSGDWIGATMKLIAEFSTILGLWAGIFLAKRLSMEGNIIKGAGYAVGLSARVLVTSAANLVVLPQIYKIPFDVTTGLIPIIGVFNIAQGSITILIGYLINDAYIKRTAQK